MGKSSDRNICQHLLITQFLMSMGDICMFNYLKYWVGGRGGGDRNYRSCSVRTAWMQNTQIIPVRPWSCITNFTMLLLCLNYLYSWFTPQKCLYGRFSMQWIPINNHKIHVLWDVILFGQRRMYLRKCIIWEMKMLSNLSNVWSVPSV